MWQGFICQNQIDVTAKLKKGANFYIDPLFFRPAKIAPSSSIQKFILFTSSISGRRSLKRSLRDYVVYLDPLTRGNQFHFKFPFLKISWRLAVSTFLPIKSVTGLCQLVHPFHRLKSRQTKSKWEHVESSGIMNDIVITRRLSVTKGSEFTEIRPSDHTAPRSRFQRERWKSCDWPKWSVNFFSVRYCVTSVLIDTTAYSSLQQDFTWPFHLSTYAHC